MERFEGRLDEATPLYEEALAIARRESNDSRIASYLCNLSAVDIAAGRLSKAGERLKESIAIIERIRLEGFAALGQLDQTSALACAHGDLGVAARLAGGAQGLLDRMGAQREPPDEKSIRPWIDRMRKVLADEAFEAAIAAGRSLDLEQALAQARAWLAGAPIRKETS
jgi:tetratricopeptide (TPR) repeat protein